jgi:hypothetical protein
MSEPRLGNPLWHFAYVCLVVLRECLVPRCTPMVWECWKQRPRALRRPSSASCCENARDKVVDIGSTILRLPFLLVSPHFARGCANLNRTVVGGMLMRCFTCRRADRYEHAALHPTPHSRLVGLSFQNRVLRTQEWQSWSIVRVRWTSCLIRIHYATSITRRSAMICSWVHSKPRVSTRVWDQRYLASNR